MQHSRSGLGRCSTLPCPLHHIHKRFSGFGQIIDVPQERNPSSAHAIAGLQTQVKTDACYQLRPI